MYETLAVFLFFFCWSGLGITVGYHRLLSHRSFGCPKFVEYFFVLGGYLAYHGSPLWWATMHRAHHRHVDTALDPHSPEFGGITNAYIGWINHKTYPAHIDPLKQSKDLINDPIYRFLEQGGNWYKGLAVNIILNTLVRVAIWAVFGWQAALATVVSGLLILQIPLLLNVVCHMPKLGYKNYHMADDSVNVWWVALMAFGEGWHNNHHNDPGAAKTGEKWHEFDVSWLIIRTMNILGLVNRINPGRKSKAPVSVNTAEPIVIAMPVAKQVSVPVPVAVGSR